MLCGRGGTGADSPLVPSVAVGPGAAGKEPGAAGLGSRPVDREVAEAGAGFAGSWWVPQYAPAGSPAWVASSSLGSGSVRPGAEVSWGLVVGKFG